MIKIIFSSIEKLKNKKKMKSEKKIIDQRK